MIDELLDVARIVSGKLRLERTRRRSRAGRARGASRSCRPRPRPSTSRSPSRPIRSIGGVYGDSARLQQIAWNLLSNAVKFTRGRRPRASCSFAAATAPPRSRVSDNGAGIPEAFLPWVFEPFRQADASSTRRHGGLGLGLSIVKHLVEAHGGTVDAPAPGEGRGATFTVRLPIRIDARHDVVVERRAADRTSRTVDVAGAGLSVLVVDDDRESRDVVAAHLASRQATVLDGRDRRRRRSRSCSASTSTSLLADIAMPGEDGYSFIRRVRALESRVSRRSRPRRSPRWRARKIASARSTPAFSCTSPSRSTVSR